VELAPAKLVVRRDAREKLGCESCDGELVRAPPGDKVVAGGRLGSTLVGMLLVDKYEDGPPLHRQKQRFERMGLSLPILDPRGSGHLGDGLAAAAVAAGDLGGAGGEGDASRRHRPAGA
jgi:transposase